MSSDIPEGSTWRDDARLKAAAKHAPLACLVLILLLHFIVIMGRYRPAISTADANGYWAQASLLFTTGRTWFEPEVDSQYVGTHWLVTDSGRFYSRYPPGLPVLVSLVYRVFGYRASVLVNPLLATLTLAGVYLLLRRLLAPWWSVAGVFVLAANPVFNQHAIWCFAHMAVACCLAWGLYFLVRWSEEGKLWQAFAGGLVMGIIPTVRYPEAVFVFGVVTFLGMHFGSREKVWRHWLAAAAGAAVPIVPLLARNQLAFGAFWRTAYSLTNEQTGFGLEYFADHFVSYIRGMNSEGVGLFFALGVVGMVMMCSGRERRRLGVTLAALAVPSLLLYMAYYWGGGRRTAGMRFLLPTFVCYILAGVWVLERVTAGAPRAARVSAAAAVLALQLVWGNFGAPDDAERLRYQKDVLVRVTDALEDHLEPGDVVMADRQILQHLDFVRRWRLVDPRNMRPTGGMRGRMRRPVHGEGGADSPSPRQAEKEKLRAESYEDFDPWEQEFFIACELDEWAGKNRLCYVGPEDGMERMRSASFGPDSFKVVARIGLPEPPSEPEMSGRTGGRRPPPGAAGRMPGGFPPRGKGGPMGRMGFGADVKELVIAEWTARPPKAQPARRTRALPSRRTGTGGSPAEVGDPSTRRTLPPGVQPREGRAPGVRTREGPAPPRDLAERLRKLRSLLRRRREGGERLDYFWPRERELKLREFMDAGRFDDANGLLDEALKDYNRGR